MATDGGEGVKEVSGLARPAEEGLPAAGEEELDSVLISGMAALRGGVGGGHRAPVSGCNSAQKHSAKVKKKTNVSAVLPCCFQIFL